MADTWKVVAQRQTQEITPAGRFVDVMEVTVETISGTTFTERIPLNAYTPDVVRQMIEQRVADVVAVDQL